MVDDLAHVGSWVGTCREAGSVMAVTSAPVSSLKVIDWLLTVIVVVQDESEPALGGHHNEREVVSMAMEKTQPLLTSN